MSGKGLEVKFTETSDDNYELIDPKNLLKQRCYIELGLNWFPFATGDRINDQLALLQAYSEKLNDAITGDK